jgi:hypothetical protein
MVTFARIETHYPGARCSTLRKAPLIGITASARNVLGNEIENTVTLWYIEWALTTKMRTQGTLTT